MRPLLGVRYTPITALNKGQLGLSVDYGVLISSGGSADNVAVLPGSSAAKAGIKEGDVILEIDNQRLTEDVSLASLIRNKKVGDKVTLKVLSGGQERDITITLEEAPQ